MCLNYEYIQINCFGIEFTLTDFFIESGEINLQALLDKNIFFTG